MLQYKKKNILIGGLLAIVVVMGIAYAAFASNLNITGTSSITNNWGVRIKSITPTNPSTNATCTDTSDPSTCTTTGSISATRVDDLSATFSASLISPGDSVTYTIVVENYGGIDAKLDTITMPESNNPAISFSRDGLDEEDVIIAGNEDELTVTVTYVNSENQGQPTSTTSNFTLTLDFVQKDGNGGAGGDTPFTGTIYRNSTTKLAISGSQAANDGVSSSIADLIKDEDYITETDYSTSTARITKLGYNYYLKHDVVNDEIIKTYVCFTNSGNEYCLRGGVDESSSVNASSYEEYLQLLRGVRVIYFANQDILSGLNDAGKFNSCSLNENTSECDGGGYDSVYFVFTGTTYVIHSRVGNSLIMCVINGSGDSVCTR